MGQVDLCATIFERKSVREYSPASLEAAIMEGIGSFMREIRPLFPEIRTEMRVLSNPEVRGMFKVSAPHLLAFLSEAKEGQLTNAGFMLQQIDLFLSSNGIGSCWQGGPAAVREAQNASDLEFVILLAFGRPAGDPHRKVLEFKREPLAKVTNIKGREDLLEAARLAPSGMNNQPWYLTAEDGTIHVHGAKSFIVGRMNKISAGIALCHLWMAAAHAGRTPELGRDRSMESKAPKGYAYVASMIGG